MQTNYFFAEPDTLNQGKFIVTVKITIYRQKLGKYPDFLASFGTPKAERDGFTTKFWYLVKDESGMDLEELSKEEAEKIVSEYETKYSNMIATAEDTGNWDDFPWKNATLIYCK